MELWVVGHVLLNPVPTVDLLVSRRHYEEATRRRQVLEFTFNCHICSYVRGRSHPPVLAEAHDAAVVLVSTLGIEHPGVNDVSHWDVKVIGTEVLEQLQGLAPS